MPFQSGFSVQVLNPDQRGRRIRRQVKYRVQVVLRIQRQQLRQVGDGKDKNGRYRQHCQPEAQYRQNDQPDGSTQQVADQVQQFHLPSHTALKPLVKNTITDYNSQNNPGLGFVPAYFLIRTDGHPDKEYQDQICQQVHGLVRHAALLGNLRHRDMGQHKQGRPVYSQRHQNVFMTFQQRQKLLVSCNGLKIRIIKSRVRIRWWWRWSRIRRRGRFRRLCRF